MGFDGKASPATTVAAFAKARAVVGVHGGALANILFCPSDAVVFEIGFSTPFAGHYRHLAAALGLKMVLLPLAANDRGIGANDISLADSTQAVNTIREVLVPPIVDA